MNKLIQKVLLIGNGINNIQQHYQWRDLIDNLIRFIDAKGQIQTDNKPFPLLYEEIFVAALKRNIRESDIKQYIAQEILCLRPNDIHREIISMNYADILTTNYDYTLENVMTDKMESLQNQGVVNETVYNIFRHHKLHQTRFWHIHGEAGMPQSITLGYEQYSGYLQRMRNYVVSGTGDLYKTSIKSLIRRIKKGVGDPYSWLDLFFTKDVFIIGLTLDFIEIHLWWLITYRQRAKLEKVMPVNNRIFYFYPKEYHAAIENKLQVLKSSGVIPQPVTLHKNNWLKYYQEVLKKVNQL